MHFYAHFCFNICILGHIIRLENHTARQFWRMAACFGKHWFGRVVFKCKLSWIFPPSLVWKHPFFHISIQWEGSDSWPHSELALWWHPVRGVRFSPTPLNRTTLFNEVVLGFPIQSFSQSKGRNSLQISHHWNSMLRWCGGVLIDCPPHLEYKQKGSSKRELVSESPTPHCDGAIIYLPTFIRHLIVNL